MLFLKSFPFTNSFKTHATYFFGDLIELGFEHIFYEVSTFDFPVMHPPELYKMYLFPA